jgi:hypothetical protein
MRRTIRLALVAGAMAVGALLPLATPAGADPDGPLAWSVSHAEARPGDTVTLTITFTNPEAVPVTFGYMSVYPTWQTQTSDVVYGMVDCRGDVTSCWWPHPTARIAYAMHLQAPIPAGGSRTVEVDVAIDPASACGGRYVHLYLYAYRESTAGSSDQVLPGPNVHIAC